MKKIILILFVFLNHLCYSQIIQEKKFDKFDSIYTVNTSNETLVGKILKWEYLYVNASFTWFMQTKFANSPQAKTFDVLIGFKTQVPTAIDDKTKIKIAFTDNTIGIYSRPDTKYQPVTDLGFYIFHVPLEDKLFTTDIKTIRIATTDTNIDYEIPKKKSSTLKDALLLVKNEVSKYL